MNIETPLGRTTDYPVDYDPDLLFPISRSDSRTGLGLAGDLPFSGVDIWNAWDLSWLDAAGKPRVATAEISVPADSTHIIESKTMKLYLGSFAMSRFDADDEVAAAIEADLEARIGGEVRVELRPLSRSDGRRTRRMPGECIDGVDVACDRYEVDASLLDTDADEFVREDLYSNLFRSLCPVTGQPDLASVLVGYVGPRIRRRSLLRYIVSYRQHGDFHENCVERMFLDLHRECRPEGLTIYARFQRRGGIDINPFRSSFEQPPKNLRLWRQ